MSRLPISLSYSKIADYHICKRKFIETYITKTVKFIETPQTLHGKEVHTELETFGKTGVKSAILSIPPGYYTYPEKIRNAEGIKGWETSFGFVDNHFNVVKDIKLWEKLPGGLPYYFTGATDSYLVTGSTACILDWKTGKMKQAVFLNLHNIDLDAIINSGQLQMIVYAVYIFIKYKEVNRVKTIVVWLKDNAKTEDVFNRNDLEHLQFILKSCCMIVESGYHKFLENGSTPPDNFHKVHKLCDWCNFKDRCPKHQ